MDPKVRLEALASIRDAAFRDFDTRRAFEWKVALSLWTAISIYIASALTSRISLPPTPTRMLIALFALAAFWLHLRFTKGMARANNINRQRQFFFEAEIIKSLELTLPKKIIDAETEASSYQGQPTNWAHGFQLGVTALLLLGAVAVTYVATGLPKPADLQTAVIVTQGR